jgi:Enoyl-(Acyl carrier protein) reductase
VNIRSKVVLMGEEVRRLMRLLKERNWRLPGVGAQLIQYGIHVNAVLPPELLTSRHRFTRPVEAQQDSQAALKYISKQIPLENRMTTAEEIAAADVFLLSPTMSGHTTSHHITVDRGDVHLDRMLSAKRKPRSLTQFQIDYRFQVP